MIANNFPGHLLAGAKTGFAAGTKPIILPWQRVAMQMPLDGSSQTVVDLGASPMPTQSKGRPVIQEFIEKTMTITPIDWDIEVQISHNAVMDDRTNTLFAKCRGAGQNFQRHINNMVFKTLNAGDGTTYGLCYDGQEFFDSDHIDEGGHYQTNQDNEYALALSNDNFHTVAVAASKTKDDGGEFNGYDYNLLVIPPDLRKVAEQICNNALEAQTGDNDINPYNGKIDYVMSPELDSTAWFLLASSESVKPLVVGIREAPNLQSAWFEPEAAAGGVYKFKFYARYNVVYGDWRLAYQGNT